MKARLVAFFVLLVASFAPRLAAAEERLRSYEIDVWPDADANVATYRLRFEYVAPASSPKTQGFKFFGTSSVEDWSVTDERNVAVAFTPSREASSNEVRLDFSVPPPSTPGGPQVIVVSMRQALPVVCGFTQCSADVPWAHKFKIPVDRMVVRVHGERAAADASFQCSGSGDSAECTRDTSSPESLDVPLRSRFGALAAVGLVLWLAALGVGIYVLVRALRHRRGNVLRLRGVIPPAPAPAYPQAGGYRVPAVIPAAAAAEPELTPEDAAAQRRRALSTSLLVAFALLIVAVGARTRLPMTMTMALATGVVFAFASVYAQREKGASWLLFAPLVGATSFAAFGVFGGLCGAAGSVIAHAIANAPPGSFQGSGSSSSSCGGGGGGGGCGGGGGGGGGGCGG